MIHPTSIINPHARLGVNVTVGPYSIIGDHVTIHDGVEIAGHVVIEGPCEIGEETQIYPFASLGQPPQDLKYKGEETRLVVGRRNVIREYVTMNRGTVGGGWVTSVGDDNLFMAQSHIAHDCIVGSGNIFANNCALAGHVTVGDHATLTAYVGVHQFCRVGDYAFIGAFTKVVKDALPYARTDGMEAKCYGANTVGLRRKGFSNESIRHIQQSFRLLIASNLNTAQALERIKGEMRGVREIDYLIDFIETSERGVTK
ncbi:MAG TPA: acyl-ACP--UDP-N-acetylglucosamine O-acyltransferase [Blastocatellia bacterium]|jgi:UDP-N-acetylglucosamine acyltransferase|nr:acyl-ACP--UDP-N-acetylglucosamine O-acyltransferase [Blastocatellia bacterium]